MTIHHFWDYLMMEHRNLASVSFIQFHYSKAAEYPTAAKAQVWCTILMFAPLDLKEVVTSILKDD